MKVTGLALTTVARRYLLCRGHRLPHPWQATAAERLLSALAQELDGGSATPICAEAYEAALERLYDAGHVALDSIGTVGLLLEDFCDFLQDRGLLQQNPHRAPEAKRQPSDSPAEAQSAPTEKTDWEIWPELMESFFSDREFGAQRLEGSTPANYRGDLEMTLRYFRENHSALNEQAIVAYVRWLELEAVNPRGGGHYSRQTVARKKTTLRSFLRYCQGKGHNRWTDLDIDGLLHTKKRDKVAQNPHRALAPHEDQAFLAAAQDLKLAQRIMVLIPRYCGLRADDVAPLSWNSIDLANGQLDYVAKKNGQRVRVPMDKQLAQLLMEYRKVAKSEAYLFPGRTRSTLDDGCVREAVRKTTVRASIGREVTPHDLRKTFATDKYYREEATLLDLQRWLGHADINTTREYVDDGAGWTRRKTIRDLAA